MSARDARVMVAGAGLGGLAAAVGLLRAGIDVRVFEQAPELGEVGAGLTLTTGAMHCLDYLGVLDDVNRYVSRPRATPVFHYATGELLVEHRGGGLDDAPDPLGPGHMFRADLHAILVEHVRRLAPDAISLGRRLTDVAQRGPTVVARFADGTTAEGDALIGCDGVRSEVRATLFGREEPAFSGKIAYRFLLDGHEARPWLGDRDETRQYVGPGKVFLRYLVSNGRLVNCVGLAAEARWTAESWSQRATREELLAEFDGWHPDVLALMRLAPPDRLLKWGIFDREPIESWTVGAITLLGDAAHPMQPFMGLGATTAIEDAAILARAFAEAESVEQALARYGRARIPRATRAFQASREQGAIFDRTDPAQYPPPGAPAHDPTFQEYDPRAVVLE